MRGRSITLYLDSDSEGAVQQRLFAPASRSEVINLMLRRYAALMANPPNDGLSQAEWSFLKDSLRERWMRTHPMSSPEAALLVHVIDAVREGRHQPSGIDGTKLIDKIQHLSTGQVVGILDRLEKAWAVAHTSKVKVGRRTRAR